MTDAHHQEMNLGRLIHHEIEDGVASGEGYGLRFGTHDRRCEKHIYSPSAGSAITSRSSTSNRATFLVSALAQARLEDGGQVVPGDGGFEAPLVVRRQGAVVDQAVQPVRGGVAGQGRGASGLGRR